MEHIETVTVFKRTSNQIQNDLTKVLNLDCFIRYKEENCECYFSDSMMNKQGLINTTPILPKLKKED